MKPGLLSALAGGIAALAMIALAWRDAPPPPPADALLPWVELIPPGWTPLATGDSVAALRDDSAAGRARWAELQAAWASAPLRQSLDGVQVRLRGYAVPLEGGAAGLTELLLVPYFGACIHSPPPPANQVVWVRLQQPARDVGSFDLLEVSGRLRVSRQQSALATSGYTLPDARLLATQRFQPK